MKLFCTQNEPIGLYYDHRADNERKGEQCTAIDSLPMDNSEKFMGVQMANRSIEIT